MTTFLIIFAIIVAFVFFGFVIYNIGYVRGIDETASEYKDVISDIRKMLRHSY